MLPDHRYYPANYGWLPGGVTLALLVFVAVLPMGAVVFSFDIESGRDVLAQAYTWRVVRFTFFQALLSTILSLILGALMAIALSRSGHFWGRAWLLRLFSVPLVMPTLVAITGLVVVFGQNGWLRAAIALLGGEVDYSIYGLHGILLAHLFFNFPLATRVFLQSLNTIPQENWRLVEQFGLLGRTRFYYLEWFAIVRALSNVGLLVFGLCFTSFTVVLALGGGPQASTIEVAIYQALRLDFDIPTAVLLSLLQIAICSVLLLIATFKGYSALLSGSDSLMSSGRRPSRSLWRSFYLCVGFLFIAAPLLAIFLHGANPKAIRILMDVDIWQTALRTALIGIASALISCALALGLLLTARHLRLRRLRLRSSRVLASLGLITLVVPGTVVSAGIFLLLRDTIDVFSHAVWFVIVVNALLGLPFACALLNEPLQSVAERYDRLCAALGVVGWRRLYWLEWPLLKKTVGLVLGLCSALAAGDLTAIAFFGSSQLQTLPLLLYQRVSGYRMDEASATALLLLLLCLALFWLFEYGFADGKRHAAD